MSLVSRIKGMQPNFTKTDNLIADFILSHPTEFLSCSVAELSTAINTSPAAIVRFVKKLQYDGLSAFRCDLAVEISKNRVESDNTLLIQKNDSLDIISDKLVYLCQQVSQTTKELLNIPSLETAIKKIQAAKNIYLFGLGASAVVANDFMIKLRRLGKNCFFQPDPSTQVATSVHINKNDVAIGFSYSGETRAVIVGMQQARRNNAYCICLTSTQSNPLHSLANTVFQIPHVESAIRIGAIGSRYGMFFLSDLLFLGIAQNQYESVEKCLTETYNVTKLLQQ